jgi:hypothetical protein
MIVSNFGQPMLAHNGVPIIVNDFIANNDVQGTSGATTTSVYALRLNEVDGFHGIVGGEAAGVHFEDVGTVQNKDSDRARLKWYCGTALKSTRSLARLSGVIVS